MALFFNIHRVLAEKETEYRKAYFLRQLPTGLRLFFSLSSLTGFVEILLHWPLFLTSSLNAAELDLKKIQPGIPT